MPIPLRVLILADRLADTELLLHELRCAGFEPMWRQVDSEAGYRTQLDPALDLILADCALPQNDLPWVLGTLQERGLDIPVIVITACASVEVAVACIKGGVAGYVLKEHLSRLGQAVHSALAEKRLRDEKRRAEERPARLNRLYEMLSAKSEAIVHVRERQRLCDRVCRIVVERGRFGAAWVGLVDRVAERVRPVAWAGRGSTYLATLQMRGAETSTATV